MVLFRAAQSGLYLFRLCDTDPFCAIAFCQCDEVGRDVSTASSFSAFTNKSAPVSHLYYQAARPVENGRPPNMVASHIAAALLISFYSIQHNAGMNLANRYSPTAPAMTSCGTPACMMDIVPGSYGIALPAFMHFPLPFITSWVSSCVS